MRLLRTRRFGWPLAIYLVATTVYLLVSADRLLGPSPNNHYAHLAQSWLQGRLDQGGPPPGTNDWACYDTVDRRACPNLRWSFPGQEHRYRFFVSFPPFPALLLVPAVALFGVDFPDPLVWALLAGLGPALLFVALRAFRERGHADRTLRDDLALTGLFAFGTVYFFAAVQGSVWFAAHVVATSCIALYLWAALDARRPLVAGAALACAFLTRPTTLPLALFFALEALRIAHGRTALGASASSSHPPPANAANGASVEWPRLLRSLALFGIPVAVGGAIALALNAARFGDPLEFGHRYLQIFWRPRVEKWGLFSYHYLAKNLAVFVASLPWISAAPPFLTVSRHGLALWFTTPNLLLTLSPRTSLHAAPWPTTSAALWLALVPVALLDLLYQNSGWVQFGYRFALDYMPLLFALLSLSGRRFGKLFFALAVFSVVVNTFGAITFDRVPAFYDTDGTQQILFQPD